MRLLVTVERYAPAIGGAERVAQRVAEGLAARGHDVHVLSGRLDGVAPVERRGGVTVHRVALAGNEARGIRGDGAQVLDLIDRVAPDVVFNYAAQTWATDCCLPVLERRERPRMVMAPCGFSGLRARPYAGYFARMPEILRAYDALIFPSERYQDWRFAHDAGASPIYIVRNGADPPETGERIRSTGGTGALVVTVGSHVLSKGHPAFARAIRALGRERRLRGVIVAPPRRGLQALRGCHAYCHARARAQHNLSVLDGSPPGVAADAIAGADLFLFTSVLESGPLVVLEAMAAATPWVSYEVGHVRELAGGLVAGGGFADLLAKAREILDGRHPELGAEGRAAWQARHRWEPLVADYERAFTEVLAAPARTAPQTPAPTPAS
jgi:glycosyltransferase involved in cell wall biosynthesis